jgi:hypothetical protein
MTYIVRVIGYNSYWTGDTEPGKCWSTNIEVSQRFETKEEAEVIVNSGMNMESVEYDFATSDIQQNPPDWDAIDEKLSGIEKKKSQEIVEINDFETVSDDIYDVGVEIVE